MNEPVRLAVDVLAIEEGFESMPYIDTEGYVTVGYGLKISGRDQKISDFHYFPNMPERVARCWMETLVEARYKDMMAVDKFERVMATCNPARQAILLSMSYQMGLQGLQQFKNTLLLIEEESFGAAAIEMLDSRWARQTAARAERHSEVMAGGELVEYYR